MKNEKLKLVLSLLLIIVFIGFIIFVAKSNYQASIKFTPGITMGQQKEVLDFIKKSNIAFSKETETLITSYYLQNAHEDEKDSIYLPYGTRGVTFQELYKNVPIVPSRGEFFFTSTGTPYDMGHNPGFNPREEYAKFATPISRDIRKMDLEPTFSTDKALETGETAVIYCFPETVNFAFDAKLLIWNDSLVWRIAPIDKEVGNSPEIFIDAHTGDILEKHFRDIDEGLVKKGCE